MPLSSGLRSLIAIDAVDGFVPKAAALLDVIHEVAREDREQATPSLRSYGRKPAGTRVGPDRDDRGYTQVFADIIDAGVESGEIDKGDRAQAQGALAAVVVGASMSAIDLSAHAHAALTDGAKASPTRVASESRKLLIALTWRR